MYEEWSLKYRPCYRDRIKRDIEGFLEKIVHETLKKCYDDIGLTRVNTVADLLSGYGNLW